MRLLARRAFGHSVNAEPEKTITNNH